MMDYLVAVVDGVVVNSLARAQVYIIEDGTEQDWDKMPLSDDVMLLL